jgi:Alpha/beta hydrolase domain
VPFISVTRMQEPVDLSKYGFVEEEWFVSGSANVYDWLPNGDLAVKVPNAPYATRIMLRRPIDPAKFTGTVVVEIVHAPNGHDFPEMFSWSGDYVLEHSDVYVGITMDPASIGALKRYNAQRYAALSMANPNPAEACAAGGRGNANATPQTSDVEEGLKWDVISQVGALLKAHQAGGPMAGFNVQYLYMTSQDAAQTTYVNAIGRHALLANGKPVYDGHVIKSGGRPARIRRCAQAPGNGDPRVAVKNAGVPVINVLQQGDVLGAVALRRADSDDPIDRFRLYEVAGTAHSSPPPYRTATPVVADLIAADGQGAVATRTFSQAIGLYTLEKTLKEPGRCQPTELVTEQPHLAYIFHGAFANLDQWVRTGTPAPKATRVDVKDVNGKPAFVLDEVGNNTGGVRTPYVDEPTRIYHPGHGDQPGCGNNFGYSEPLNWARLEARYGSYKNYAAKVSASIEKLAKDRWVTASDAQRIREELLAPPTPAGGMADTNSSR